MRQFLVGCFGYIPHVVFLSFKHNFVVKVVNGFGVNVGLEHGLVAQLCVLNTVSDVEGRRYQAHVHVFSF